MPTGIDDRVAELRGFTSEVVRYKRLAFRLWVSALVLVPVLCVVSVLAWSKWRPVPAPPVKAAAPQPQAADPFNEEIRKTSVEEWFARLGRDEELGYKPFTVMNALVKKAKEDERTREGVIRKASETIYDLRQNMFRRWQCCYVLSGIGDPRGIPPISRALKDQSPIVRGVAICAMGAFDQPEAKSALETAFKQERDPRLRQDIQKALQGGFLKTPGR